MLPALGGKHYFALVPSLGGGLNSPPNAYWDLFLSTWQAISRPIILLPAAAGSIISIFGQKRTKKSHSVFLLFPLLKISVQILWLFNTFSKKRFLPWCGAHFWKACARTQMPKRLSSGSDECKMRTGLPFVIFLKLQRVKHLSEQKLCRENTRYKYPRPAPR